MSDLEFKPWPKIPRGGKCRVVITEKIDGTNACIVIQDGKLVGVQSRKRFITPEDDNYGFARWAYDNEEVLVAGLKDGHHYGEWAGHGIQGNPHCLPEKRFFLFNTLRWSQDPSLPVICDVVPILYEGEEYVGMVEECMEKLLENSEGVYVPEGVVVFNLHYKTMYKQTFKYSEGKWKES